MFSGETRFSGLFSKSMIRLILLTLLVSLGMNEITWALPTGGKVPIYPLENVKRGQKGTGLTTIYGTKPEQFEFEVIDVKHNFLPNMSIILVKSDDPKFAVRGFWAGMSGSPLFIDGKLACAFSYGWSFTKTPIGACTPMKYMLKQGFQTPLVGQAKDAKAGAVISESFIGSQSTWQKMAPGGDINELLHSEFVPTPKLNSKTIPLSIAGATTEALSYAQKMWSGGMTPFRAGSIAGSQQMKGPSKFVLGSSIAVMLVRGDMTITGTGTVSYVDGDRLLAFGHPMFENGEAYAPIATSHVHMIVNSQASPFVVASPIKEVGSLVLDTQAMIMADMRLRTAMIPMSMNLTLNNAGKTVKNKFYVEALNSQDLTSTIIRIATMNATSLYMPDKVPSSVVVSGKIKIAGESTPIEFTDHNYSDTGAIGPVMSFRGFKAVDAVMFNPFKKARIESVELSIVATQNSEPDIINDIRLRAPKLVPGEKNYVDLQMIRKGQKPILKRVGFDVPPELAGSRVRLQVLSGNLAKADAAVPTDWNSFLNVLRSFSAGTDLIVRLTPKSKGLSRGSQVVLDLPDSVADRIPVKASLSHHAPYNLKYDTKIPWKPVLANAKGFLVDVANQK